MVRYRMLWRFGLDRSRFPVRGEPGDLRAAKDLAQEDPVQFGWWALSLLHARPLGARRLGAGRAAVRVEGALPFRDQILDDEAPPLLPAEGTPAPGKDWTLVVVQPVVRPSDLPALARRAEGLGARRVLATGLELPASTSDSWGTVAGQGQFQWPPDETGVHLIPLETLLRRDLTPALIQRPLRPL